MPRKALQPDADIRTDADILADALKVLAPRAGEYEKWRKLFTKCMESMRTTKRADGKVPTPLETMERLNDSCKRLRAARVVLVAMGSPKELIEAYDSQLRVAENILLRYQRAADHPNMRNVRFGRSNMVAVCAAVMARQLLEESGQRVLWKQWRRLSALLYEAATGEYDVNLSKYMIMCKSGRIFGGLAPQNFT
jgi:branched-subunit amino acid aminotransferase/4-amino-4-deoxychorismate lyase